MSKKQWLLAILVCIGIGYLVISKINPEMGWSIDNILGGTIGTMKTGIEATPLWQQYDIYISGAFFASIAALLVYRGRDMYDSVRGIARVRATDQKVTWQQAPPAAEPQPIPQLTQKVEPTPVVEVEKKESA